MIEAYLQFVGSGTGGLTTIGLCLVISIVVATLVWRSKHGDLRALLVAAGVLTLLAVAGYLAIIRFRWWGGTFVHDVAISVQLATLVPTALVGWLAWLGGYGWLASRVRYPQLVYLAVGMLLVIMAAAADRVELSHGLIDIGGDGNVWFDAALLLALMFVPLIAYDAIRHTLRRLSESLSYP
jgi:hypothetical protein